MATYKRIVCLANSRKHGRICIAGIELGWKNELLGWIRPTGTAEDGALFHTDIRTQDGSETRLLDIVQIPFFRAYPVNHQPENWAIEANRRWQRKGQYDFSAITERAASEGDLWANGYSSLRGMNDRVPLDVALRHGNSLQLTAVQNLSIEVADHFRNSGERTRRMQATFSHSDNRYRLWITDRAMEAIYLPKPDGIYSIENAILTLSLGEPNDGWCYKLIAGVLLPPEGAAA